MATTPKHYFVILCGGTGPRLWPLSRADRPKQFLKLFNNKSLLEETYNRIRKIAPSKNIFIVSNKRYKSQLEKLLANKVPKENFLYEPLKRNTAMAITFTLSHLHKLDPDAIVTTTPSDHYVTKTLQFKKNINQAHQIANKTKHLVTIGVKATTPNPSYGYIIPQQKNKSYSHISFFIEKPDIDTAKKLIKKNCYWNTDIHTFRIKTMLSEFQKLHPEYFEFFEQLGKDLTSKQIEAIFKKSPKLNINRAISEKSKQMMVVPATFDWSDVGEWKSIYQQLKSNPNGISTLEKDNPFITFQSKDCLVKSSNKKLVGLVGVNNLAIIDTPDALLICDMNKSSNLRDLITKMVSNKKHKDFFLKSNDE
jgi:mannose-1-phosphate guanylyltransferase